MIGETKQINNRRYYYVDENTYYPSVTTVLGEFTDKSYLDVWRENVGKEKAAEISNFSANRGTIMHQMIEYYLGSDFIKKRDRLLDAQKKIITFVEDNGFTEGEMLIGRKLFFNFYNSSFFNRIKRVVDLETVLISHKFGGYAGRFDCCYINNNDQMIILDFKSAKKEKSVDQITSYFIQASAYFIAYWEMFNVKPSQCEIWISNEDVHNPQGFYLDYRGVKKYGRKFLSMVKEYHKKYH